MEGFARMMEVTDEIADFALYAYWEAMKNDETYRECMRSAITAALAVKPPPIQVVWATPMEQPPHAPQT
jgi:hypothetical protein